MKVSVYGVAERLQAPAAADDDSSHGHQGIVAVHFIGQLEGCDETSYSLLGQGLGIPQTKGKCEIADRRSCDGFQLFCWFLDLGHPILALVFTNVVMVPGMTADDIAGIV